MASPLFRAADRPLLNLALLAATAVTTFYTFFRMFSGDGVAVGERVQGSLVFSAALLLILGAHEMGHYLLARAHRVDTSLPYFIPLPLLGVGTLGAVIRIRGRIPHKNALVDIGAAGPLAGLVVAIPLLVYGFTQSTVAPAPPSSAQFPGEQSLWILLGQLWELADARLSGRALEVPAQVVSGMRFGDSLLMLVLQRVALGPLPDGMDVYVHPLVIAGWFGLLVTMLNLIPIGQLDGGHLTHALFGDRARAIGKLVALLMLGLCLFFSVGWVVWLIVTTKFVGFRHPEVVSPEAPLSPGRKVVCALCLLAFVLCVMPVPLSQVVISR